MSQEVEFKNKTQLPAFFLHIDNFHKDVYVPYFD